MGASPSFLPGAKDGAAERQSRVAIAIHGPGSSLSLGTYVCEVHDSHALAFLSKHVWSAWHSYPLLSKHGAPCHPLQAAELSAKALQAAR